MPIVLNLCYNFCFSLDLLDALISNKFCLPTGQLSRPTRVTIRYDNDVGWPGTVGTNG